MKWPTRRWKGKICQNMMEIRRNDISIWGDPSVLNTLLLGVPGCACCAVAGSGVQKLLLSCGVSEKRSCRYVVTGLWGIPIGIPRYYTIPILSDTIFIKYNGMG